MNNIIIIHITCWSLQNRHLMSLSSMCYCQLYWTQCNSKPPSIYFFTPVHLFVSWFVCFSAGFHKNYGTDFHSGEGWDIGQEKPYLDLVQMDEGGGQTHFWYLWVSAVWCSLIECKGTVEPWCRFELHCADWWMCTVWNISHAHAHCIDFHSLWTI